MFNDIPLTGSMLILSCLVNGGAWLYLSHKAKQAAGAPQRPVRFMIRFFMFMAIFCAFMAIPYVWLPAGADAFSQAMAWGYVVGHIFCYIAFMYIARMVCATVPKLSNLDRPVVGVWLAVTAIITIINAQTMIWGVQPVFNYTQNLTEFRAAPVVGIAIAVIASIALIPAIILFGINAVKSHGPRRIKSSLLVAGLLVIMVGGPLHDVARTGMVYAAADIISIIGIIIMGIGVAYRLENGLAEAPAPHPVMPASNTV